MDGAAIKWTVIGLAAAVVGVVVYKVAKNPGAVAKAAAGAAGEVASAGVGAIGATVGAPTPDETTQDPLVSRYIMDHPLGGQWSASIWSGVPAYTRALFMASGSGTPPPAGTALATRFPIIPQASYDETDRLAARYPKPVDYVDTYDPLGTYLGQWPQP